MTKLCKQYLSDIKAFFPIMGKPERTYLAKLAENVDDYCIEEKTTTIEEIYDGFGHPSEVASTYLTSVDTSYLIKRIQMTKWIRRGIIALLVTALIGVSIYGINTYKTYKLLEQEQIFFDETEIID